MNPMRKVIELAAASRANALRDALGFAEIIRDQDAQ
jgi:hypothetical protein